MIAYIEKNCAVYGGEDKYKLGIASPSLTHAFFFGGESSVIGCNLNGEKIEKVVYIDES